MTDLDRVLPEPRLVELDHVEVAAPPDRAFDVARHADFGLTPLVRALFVARRLPSRLAGGGPLPPSIHLDDIGRSPAPGFRTLAESPRELVVGAIGKVWQLDIPFLAIDDAAHFAAFDEPGWVKVAWALRSSPLGDRDARVEFEVRVTATDDESWARFRRYFRLIGPGSHFIRHQLLSLLASELGTPEAAENERELPGDALVPDAIARLTHGITIEATPEAIWPWLVQMGCRRAGFYSYDILDNANLESAREIHPELQHLRVGDMIPARPDVEDGFEVLEVTPPRALVLGGLRDLESGQQIPFASARPEHFAQSTWAFALEPLDERRTRLHVRVRATFSAERKIYAALIGPVHHFMEKEQLRGLAARAEGRMAREGIREVWGGIGGAAQMALVWLTPFLRRVRSHHGLTVELASREHEGDSLVPSPRWGWTHGIEIDAPAEQVWPWVAQIGADRGGFYSHQWLENLAGCEIQNAETVHPEWAVRKGSPLVLHPKMPPLEVVSVEPGRSFVAFGAPDEAARREGGRWAAVSWLFQVEPLGPDRSRFISRFRADCSDDLATRLAFGPLVTGSIGHVMDLRMLRGVKERVERRSHEALAEPDSPRASTT